ncbi:MAG: TMEM175 family protein [Clostridium sp.]
MKKSRVEAFTDGVVAIIITILVLGVKIPDGHSLSDLWNLREVFFAYALSFFLIATLWNNYHHMFQIADKIDGKVMWVNTVMLFFLSLVPFATAWVGQNLGQLVPEITYGVVFLLIDLSYFLVATTLVKVNGKDSKAYKALHNEKKVYITLVINIISIILGFVYPPLVMVLCFTIILLWFVPNKKVEKLISE